MSALQTAITASAFAVGLLLVLVESLRQPLAKRFGINEARSGRLLLALNVALLPLMLLSGLLIDAWGVRPVLIGGSLLTGLALLTLAVGRDYRDALAAVLLFSAGEAAICAGTIVLMSPAFGFSNPAASLNLGHVFIGLGVLVMPPLADLQVGGLGFRRGVGLMAVAGLVPGMAIAVVPGGEFPLTEPQGGLGRVLGDPLLWMAALAFFLYCPIEAVVGKRLTTYLAELGQPEPRAARLLMGFWLSFLAGRLLTAFLQSQGSLPERWNRWVILCSALLAALALGNLSGAEKRSRAAPVILWLGACLGPIYPTLLGLVFGNFPGGTHGTAYGALFALGATGGLAVPPLWGTYARRVGPRQALRILLLVALGLAGISLLLGFSMD
jgi:fucose permease